MKTKVPEVHVLIDKARVSKIGIEVEEDGEIKISVSANLMAGVRKLSDIYFSSESWVGKEKMIEIPAKVLPLVDALFMIIEPVIYDKINGKLLEEAKEIK